MLKQIFQCLWCQVGAKCGPDFLDVLDLLGVGGWWGVVGVSGLSQRAHHWPHSHLNAGPCGQFKKELKREQRRLVAAPSAQDSAVPQNKRAGPGVLYQGVQLSGNHPSFHLRKHV